ncbi:hypothetical protein EKO27_g3294 [Xylaria grammica]|uniref:Pyrroloquinoline quinone-dependent pyranose dehydrogenase beta-propeller domain-containing protein n=1 Tax=Xylaria grammica TaxID=363999 RepID=A0A439DBJ2_9PEZI|nr:hypothetical protein EKO27_g3294 [Xylaria grammica]
MRPPPLLIHELFGELESPRTPNWYGYPTCFIVWEPSLFTDTTLLKTGSQFVVAPNATFNGESCNSVSNSSRLSFPAHTAPIGSVFNTNSTNLYITFRGSWDRQPAAGYFVAEVPFTKMADSKTGYKTILSAQGPGSCNSSSLTQSTC